MQISITGTSSLGRLVALAVFLGRTTWAASASASGPTGVVVDGKSFALHGDGVSYRFHVDDATGDLISDHFGGRATETVEMEAPVVHGWVGLVGRVRREYPDTGRGDFRIPAIVIGQAEGHSISALQYRSHELVPGKPGLAGLPATFGTAGDVTTLIVHMYDNYSAVAADVSYSVFPHHDAIVRSVRITNKGQGKISIDKAASFSVDLPSEDLDMIQLSGDWAREAHRIRRKVQYGTQGFGSTTGSSSHLHNPFLALVRPTTTESQGEAWAFSLVYTGSFAVDVEKGSQGFTRATVGFHPSRLSWSLGPDESLTTPEAVAVYSAAGLGGASRKLHSLYRKHLIRSKYGKETRPVLLNSWEGLGFNFNQSTIYTLAQASAALAVKLFVLDDGWFGNRYQRVADTAGLGDWQVNMNRFPDGLPDLVDRIVQLQVANSSAMMKFGLWLEPEMVNANSSLYESHADWVLHAASYPRSERRNQLVLNLALPEVQKFIIDSVSGILSQAPIAYVKWDNNRGVHESARPSADHAYMLGLYHVWDTLTSRFPDVLWEGCASGGGRFDAGVLYYFPQIWTSDNTDAHERITIQFGTSVAYPAAAMGAHMSAVPNGQTGRVSGLRFRAHVAIMAGSFGLELDPAELAAEERAALPGLVALAETVGPVVVGGELWRLSLPEESNWPAALFVAPDGARAVLFWFQLCSVWNQAVPSLRLQGLDPVARYVVVFVGDGVGDGDGDSARSRTYSGATLMNVGLRHVFGGDDDSTVVMIERA